MSALNNSLLLGQESGGGYAISRSLRFNAADSSFLSRTPASAGNRKTFTFAAWVKRSAAQQVFQSLFTTTSNNFILRFEEDTIVYYDYNGSSFNSVLQTAAVYRDYSAWMHVVFAYDSTNATSTERIRLYVNGSRITQFASGTYAVVYPSSNADSYCNNNVAHRIGSDSQFSSRLLDGYLADIHFCDGTAYDASAFGEFDANGIWQPKKFSSVYGSQGWHLDFADNSTTTALGTDTSGQGNTWTVNNLSVTAGAGNDSLVDVPTNGSDVDTGSGGQVRGNYCTLNPLIVGAATTLSDGNLQAFFTGWNSALGTIAFPRTGKWYYEVNVATNESLIGIVSATSVLQNAVGTYFTASVTSYGYYSGASKNSGPGNSSSSYGASFTTGDIIGVAFDADAGSLTFYKNGVSQGTAFTGVAGDYLPAMGSSNASGQTLRPNFGQRPFAYTAPSGFKALCTANLPAPVVTKPSTVMDVALYTGNGSTQTISGLGFSPDLVWVKNRSNSASHRLTDVIRGGGYSLLSNSTSAEILNDANGYIASLNADGFTVSAGASDALGVNQSSNTYVAWTWDAGSSTVTDNTGSIQSTRRTNASAGISIVSYTGATSSTVGHGLGVAPGLIILKQRNNAADWPVYHSSLGVSSVPLLNATIAPLSLSNYWGSSVTSTTFGTASNGAYANTFGSIVAYCFAPVAGYANAFSYSGNGSSDGPMVWLGFRPRLILLKRTDSANNWILVDSARDTYNSARYQLLPNLSDSEYTVADTLDILSNGFKLRDSNASRNASGGTYIGFAWAESPFQYARAR